jgi:hypothetical protein
MQHISTKYVQSTSVIGEEVKMKGKKERGE